MIIGALDDRIITRFLGGSTSAEMGAQLTTTGSQIDHNPTGWTMVTRYKSSIYMLSLDRPGLSDENAQSWRQAVLERSIGADKPVLPVSWLALNRAIEFRNQQARAQSKLPLIDPIYAVWEVTPKFEAVFSIDHRYYLSGYDEQESPPLYFLCRLPRGSTTVDEARESLKPTSVLKAEAIGTPVKRQGDVFAIKSGLTKRQLEKQGAKFNDGMQFAKTTTNNIRPEMLIYGTAHTADKLAHMPDGRMLAKGSLHHNPYLRHERRGPDHAARPLDRGWWWLTKNTVPTMERG